MSNPAETAQEVKKDDKPRIMEEIEKDTLIELETGMSGEREQLPGAPKEYSGWDVYNNEAKKVDTELVNDWRDSLNSLLLFAAIFAAVLTAFIIESKKLLESDPSDAMLEVMIFFTNSMANGTFTPYSRPQFEPESSSVTINCLFFASLSASLVAGLASVVALQWVADYDAAITRGGSSPEDRAKRRQFRYAGVVWWKMSEIIAALPLLLYSSVVLFFTGLTLWMWDIHHTVGVVVAGGMGIAVSFYGVTTLLSVASVSAPFRTPLSRLAYSSVYLFFSIVDLLSRYLPIPSSRAWLKERHQRYTGAVKRDNDEVSRRHWLGVDALSWLASHLSISLDSYDRLLLLANELRKQDQEHLATPRFNESPWFSIFDLLAWRNFNTAGLDDDISKEETRAVAILAHCYRMPTIYAIIRPKEEMLYCSDDKSNEYWSQCCDIARTQWSPPSPSTDLNLLFLLLRDIPIPTKDTEKQIESTIRLSRWRNSPKRVQEAPKNEMHSGNAPLASSSASVIVVDRFLKAGEKDLWVARDDRSLYQAAVSRIVRLHVENGEKMTPVFLDTLRWRFESLLLGDEGHAMDATTCLSRPLLYRQAFKRNKAKYRSIHGNFTLLLAINLNSFSGAERARQVKQILTMMWVSPEDLDNEDYDDNEDEDDEIDDSEDEDDEIDERQGMESFFDANRNIINSWVCRLENIPHFFEILEHLSRAQAEQPDIGSLWRAVDSQATLSHLQPALQAFEDVIGKGVTPEQHSLLIELVCRDIEFSPPGVFRAGVHSYDLRRVQMLRDPCLNFIGTLSAGVEVEFEEDTSLLEASWIRIAKHLTAHHDGTESLTMLKLHASAWFLIPGYMEELCERALLEPQALARLKCIFEYPVQCDREGHNIGEGHLLLHIFPHIRGFSFPVNIPALTEFPMKDKYLDPTLAAFILSDGYQGLLQEQIRMQDNERCVDQILEIVSILLSSQYSMLAILSTIPTRYVGYPDDLAGFSMCINKALNLPYEQRVISLIHPLVSRMQVLMGALKRGSTSEQAIARREATKAIERLHIHLGRLRLSSRTNSRILSCVRLTGSFDPAIRWLRPYTDNNVIF